MKNKNNEYQLMIVMDYIIIVVFLSLIFFTDYYLLIVYMGILMCMRGYKRIVYDRHK